MKFFRSHNFNIFLLSVFFTIFSVLLFFITIHYFNGLNFFLPIFIAIYSISNKIIATIVESNNFFNSYLEVFYSGYALNSIFFQNEIELLVFWAHKILYALASLHIFNVLVVLLPVLLSVAFMTIIERKQLAAMQRRVGPVK